MNSKFLDYTGLAKYTENLEAFIEEKVSGLVPTTRKVNAKTLTEDINLTAYDVNAVPTTRQINGHQLGFDLNLTASDLNAVPTTRTINGKPLTTDITLSASDIAGLTTLDLSGYVPTSRTVNGKALTGDITLNASDVSARPSSWTPTASEVGALPISGGTLTGDLKIKSSGNYGTALTLGDGDYVHISEPTDDCMEIKAKKVNFVLSDTTDEKFTVNGESPFGSGGVGQSMAGQSVKPTSSTTVIAAAGAEIFNDYRVRSFNTSGVANGGNVASGSYSFAEGGATTAQGAYSHAEGSSTLASGTMSHAEGSRVKATGNYSHAEGADTTASGEYSHAEGNYAKSDGSSSHAEGSNTFASGHQSHAEGNKSSAIGKGSHAEGWFTSASGDYSHAEGSSCEASSTGSHAEGSSCEASGAGSHAEGWGASASGSYSHAEGSMTTASNYASHASGKYNNAMSNGAIATSLVGDVFVIGNGTSTSARSNALRLAYEGTLYLTKAYKSTGADYAEYFEWLDGNPQAEDRVGRFVTLEGDKIKLAQEGDYVLGVVSGQPCIIGNADEDWLGRWEHDDFNRFVKEYLVEKEAEVIPPEDVKDDPDALHAWILSNDVRERDGRYFKIEVEVVDYVTPSWRHKANPNYDASQPYVERKDRQEWDAVGMVGVLSVIDDGTCTVNGYAKVTNDGIATAATESEKSWRVIQRVTDHIIKIVFYGK